MTGTTIRAAALALLWGSAFLWTKLALDGGLSPAQITVARCALGAAVLLALARAARQRLPRDRATWRHLTIAALLCNALPFLLISIAEQRIDSGLAGVLHATTPLWSLLIALVIGTERPLRAARLAGILTGFAGTVLIFAPWHSHGPSGPGIAAMLAAAASYAIAFAYMARHLADRGTGPLALSAAQLLAATGLATVGLAVEPAPAGPPSLTGILAVLLLGTLATGVTFHLNYRLIADEGPTATAAIGYLLPVVSISLGALLLDEQLTARTLTGMAVVLAGVALTRPRPATLTAPDDAATTGRQTPPPRTPASNRPTPSTPGKPATRT
ncbi:DMT family transporter [Micromonospora sp. SL4-19]|uniref:DMT family transporter n=1 Tax=Micromonospora sp. SL4-19 TaxID=3399129 RepID=UPI003A4DFE8F